MSFEAINSISGAEFQAKADVENAQAKVRQLIAEAENAGALALDAARIKADSELAELGKQVNAKAKAQTEKLSGELENHKAVLSARAEGRLEQAAALIVERIVNG